MATNQKNVFEQFTNQYALSKTLRFELKPVGKTREWMDKHLEYDADLQTFLKDQKIENAYRTLKPIFDSLHEEFISESLESETVSKIDFSQYLEKYKNKQTLGEKDLAKIEKGLRIQIGNSYQEVAKLWKEKAGKDSKGKDVLKKKGFNILTESGILEYIRKNADQFVGIQTEEKILNALGDFKGFFTYLSGFNQNRENYYAIKDEKATAVATRIVHDNLPKFCDNFLALEARESEYLTAYSYLEETGNSLVDKDGKKLWPIQMDLFDIGNFNKYLSQNGIDTYNKQISNANFLINLYNQLNSKESGFKKLQLFKTLFKQIGCGERKVLFFALTHNKKSQAEAVRKTGENEAAFSVEEVLQLAWITAEKFFRARNGDELINTVPELINYLRNRENYLGIYWSKNAINTISSKYFANWYELKEKLQNAKVFNKGKKGDELDIKIPDVIELKPLFDVLDAVEDWKKMLFKPTLLDDVQKVKIIENSESASKALLELIFSDIDNCVEKFFNEADSVLKLDDYGKDENKNKIKSWMDQALAVSQILKYFLVKENKIKGTALDSVLVEALNSVLRGKVDFDGVKTDVDWFKWYDALRNFLTKKPQDNVKENKLKLNFENGTLASGWDINKEPNNFCVVLKDTEEREYLAVIAKGKDSQKGYNRVFEKSGKNPLYQLNGESWRKMEYKLLPGPNKMLPKCLLPGKDRSKYGATEEILNLYDKGVFKKGDNFAKDGLSKIIDFYKAGLKKYEDWQCFDFSFKSTKDYEDISQFYSDVEKQGYKLDFVNINKAVLDELVAKGEVYLFEIKSQDSNSGKKSDHHNNLHTIYWRAVFEDAINRPKLNGEAEIFYRKPLPVDKLEKIKDRNGKQIIKNYRFSKEKFVFHVPITLNFCLKNYKINDLANDFVNENKTFFLGIDRGEKHLAYYYLVDEGGNIVKDENGKPVEGTLNLPFVDQNGNPRKVKVTRKIIKDGVEQAEIVECGDYNEMLIARSGERDFARKNWQTIGTIKELKEGYISQAIRKIADLAVQYNAFIVMEDLNTGFKRGRQKIENSVYQKFELALAKKLNFLVDKKAKLGEVGSVTRALQLTSPVTNYGDIENRKQVGVLLYTRANYTSQTDPMTGWRKSIYLQKGSEEKIKKQIVKEFTDIGYDGSDYFFDYKDELGKSWRLYSGKNGKGLDRYRGKRTKGKNVWEVEKIDVMGILDNLFEDFDKSKSLLIQIVDGNFKLNKSSEQHTAWESLRFVIDAIQQIRNSGNEEWENDYLESPVRDNVDSHFDSRKAKDGLPSSGDANGAFNIARKGVVMGEHIKRGYNLLIRDQEWDAWLAGREVWERWLKENKDLVIKKK